MSSKASQLVAQTSHPEAKLVVDRRASLSVPDEDRLLLARMAVGDEQALGALYDRMLPFVHAVVLRLLRDDAEVELVVEEAFWQAWRQATRYEPKLGSVVVWLGAIARNESIALLGERTRLT